MRKKPNHGNGYVYVIHAVGTEYIKIGTATDIKNRMFSMQTGCPHELVLIAQCNGGRLAEQDMHKRLKGKAVRGEWYDRRDAKVAEVVTAIINDGGITRLWARDTIAAYRSSVLRQALRLAELWVSRHGRQKGAEVV